jgi:hypothetical protein
LSAYGDNKPWRRPEPGSRDRSPRDFGTGNRQGRDRFGGNDRFNGGSSGYKDSWGSERPARDARGAKKPVDDDFDRY